MQVLCRLGGFAVFALTLALGNQAQAQSASEAEIARVLAEMLQSARGVIGAQQDLINSAQPADKELTGERVLSEAVAAFVAKGNPKPGSFSDERLTRLLEAQTQAISEVMAENQSTINRGGVEFKGFVPAVFARLVNERFAEKVGQEATIKVTAPLALVRNRKARPDAWELAVIEGQLMQDTWPVGAPYEEVADVNGRQAYRMLMPEYYSEGCMACHGGPAGEIDITGYPKEGGTVGELGGVISISLFR
jgi:hypothetical protein